MDRAVFEAGDSSEPSLRPAPVRVEGGLLAGLRDARTGVDAYLGVPFAAPPVDALRWRLPAPVVPWDGVREATRFAPQCTQPGRAADSVYAEYSGVQAMREDCLYLNVWTPVREGDRALPVMVWIHGGAFQQGSAANPVFVRGDLARKGVLLVTINYRLGPFGFMAHPELSAEQGGASGNYGLFDMAAALGWVQRNIAAFGGDPAKVTVFGQSAGAHGVVSLMASPEARGLFRHAIAQSFGISPTEPLATGESQGLQFAAGDSIATLRALDAETLLQRYLATSTRFMPIVDGRFLVRTLAATFAAGEQQAVPFLTGWNRDEGSTFPGVKSLQAFRDQLARRFGARAAEAEALYPAADDVEAEAASKTLFGDTLFGGGVLAAARAQAPHAPTYVYHFAHLQPFGPAQRYREADPASALGVFHSSEYPYVFGTTRELTRDWGADDDRLTALMQAYWCRFATTGDPNGPGLPEWPRFEEGSASLLELVPAPHVVDVPRRAQLQFLA
ncbi:carboxylesterase family protein [Variovorax sp. J22P168]|uniref:carboxylesterase/lipase family protein n=1 Tax=Variovorax jilinensis TaxID=3053513 RepID=UPI002576F12F|nr:carboxylesterase family protein [Variovorax sp. J22P168]MDM0013875.1 carboxylesterase family protein [Variovorax sp. J22P168]